MQHDHYLPVCGCIANNEFVTLFLNKMHILIINTYQCKLQHNREKVITKENNEHQHNELQGSSTQSRTKLLNTHTDLLNQNVQRKVLRHGFGDDGPDT